MEVVMRTRGPPGRLHLLQLSGQGVCARQCKGSCWFPPPVWGADSPTCVLGCRNTETPPGSASQPPPPTSSQLITPCLLLLLQSCFKPPLPTLLLPQAGRMRTLHCSVSAIIHNRNEVPRRFLARWSNLPLKWRFCLSFSFSVSHLFSSPPSQAPHLLFRSSVLAAALFRFVQHQVFVTHP